MKETAAYKQQPSVKIVKKMMALKKYFSDESVKTKKDENEIMLETIKQARAEYLSAVSSFDNAENDELLDYYIYKMKACQLRYDYLIKKAKELGLRTEVIYIS